MGTNKNKPDFVSGEDEEPKLYQQEKVIMCLKAMEKEMDLMLRSNPKGAKRICQSYLGIAQEHKLEFQTTYSRYMLGYTEYLLGNLRLADKMLKKAIVESVRSGFKTIEFQTRLAYGVLKRTERNYSEALYQYKISLTLSEPRFHPAIFSNISVLFLDRGDKTAALKFINRALENSKSTIANNTFVRNTFIIKKARILTEQNDYSEAEVLITQTFINSRSDICASHTILSALVLSRIYNQTNNKKQAYLYARRAQHLLKFLPFKTYENGVFFELVDVLTSLKKHTEAQVYLNKIEKNLMIFSKKKRIKILSKIQQAYRRLKNERKQVEIEQRIKELKIKLRQGDLRKEKKEYKHYFEYIEKELEISVAKTTLHETQRIYEEGLISHAMENERLSLKLFQAQLNPHFVLNSLNSINTLIITNRNHEAEKYIFHYSKLLRKIFEIRDKEVISIKEELILLKEYVMVENFRFTNKIKILISAKVREYFFLIPPLLLQPIVENAIKHSFHGRECNFRPIIKIRILETQSGIDFHISNNGRITDNEINNISPKGGLSLTQKRIIEFNYNVFTESNLRFRRKKSRKIDEIWTEVSFTLKAKTGKHNA